MKPCLKPTRIAKARSTAKSALRAPPLDARLSSAALVRRADWALASRFDSRQRGRSRHLRRLWPSGLAAARRNPARRADGIPAHPCLYISTVDQPSGGWFHTALAPGLALFVLAFAATRFRRSQKEQIGLAESRRGRSASQVAANMGIAALAAMALPPYALQSGGLTYVSVGIHIGRLVIVLVRNPHGSDRGPRRGRRRHRLLRNRPGHRWRTHPDHERTPRSARDRRRHHPRRHRRRMRGRCRRRLRSSSHPPPHRATSGRRMDRRHRGTLR